jgi:thiol-disulfide isomerase/thioredoxin
VNSNRVNLSDFAGQVVLIEFWATWCPPCRESIPELVSFSKHYTEEELTFLGISVDEGGDAVERVKAFMEKYNVTFTSLLDDGDTRKAYDLRSIPTLFLLDRDHRIAEKHEGFIPSLSEELSSHVESLL